MNRFINDHQYLELPKGIKPTDYVRSILVHFGFYLGGVFSLQSCKDPKCCNPFHFKITANKASKRHLKNQYQDIKELVEDIEWDTLHEVGLNRYLEIYNSSEFLEENPFLKISKNELIQAMVLKTLEMPYEDRNAFWNKFAITNDRRLLKQIEKRLEKI